mmetsp:Transcript_22509/g.62479  ORF Transcript_22509/g.62479 Transcript_22509/m.62479 type:complete len:635 (+) Transcript_22509:59-1963(+)|eukprot:CAMPEP_0168743620 /NCGR_PEP_ID=MMETSP0724-20121128/13670_1 /TAXON_ID=265536 /ORGANISM="Amphiprora sp., Strain CCMP467" /LENGTH=634 /DNA_ID=CAMNT_0008791255 /DNA_START=7 /DNA_END=1911 /DNA_ORIENTATION=-
MSHPPKTPPKTIEDDNSSSLPQTKNQPNMSKDDSTAAEPVSTSSNDANATTTTTTTSPSSSSTPTDATSSNKGIAGRINYAQWDKVATNLVQEHDQQVQQEEADQKAQLGLDGKYARSAAEADERQKLKDVQKVKKTLDAYRDREQRVVQSLVGLLGPVVDDDKTETDEGESKTTADTNRVVRITRRDMPAGTRVVRLQDTSGQSLDRSTIVLTQDLSHLESKMAANAMAKHYPDDAENDVPQSPQNQTQTSVFGVIKVFLQNLHHCTVWIKCKIISGTVEIHNCTHLRVKVQGPEATVATVQADLCRNLSLEFHDAPSGTNKPSYPGQVEPNVYWGRDKDDRIFHAGVSNLVVSLYRDGWLETSCTADYLQDGACAVGNATAEEMQFVTSCSMDDDNNKDDPKLVTESVVRAGQSTGTNVRAMTQREIDAAAELRAKAVRMAEEKAESLIQIKDKDGNAVVQKQDVATKKEEEDVIEEVISPDVQEIIDECQQNKARGNEAFGTGEYGQAILLYSLALDKADELPHNDDDNDSNNTLFPRDVVYSNRAACFLKLGQHEKAQQDAAQARQINPDNVKALFREGLAWHAMQNYEQARPLLAQAHQREPKNAQIRQALQFCEVRLEQEYRRRMAGE